MSTGLYYIKKIHHTIKNVCLARRKLILLSERKEDIYHMPLPEIHENSERSASKEKSIKCS